jgi:hypothetical protein
MPPLASCSAPVPPHIVCYVWLLLLAFASILPLPLPYRHLSSPCLTLMIPPPHCCHCPPPLSSPTMLITNCQPHGWLLCHLPPLCLPLRHLPSAFVSPTIVQLSTLLLPAAIPMLPATCASASCHATSCWLLFPGAASYCLLWLVVASSFYLHFHLSSPCQTLTIPPPCHHHCPPPLSLPTTLVANRHPPSMLLLFVGCCLGTHMDGNVSSTSELY